jgi:hypothetical protein
LNSKFTTKSGCSSGIQCPESGTVMDFLMDLSFRKNMYMFFQIRSWAIPYYKLPYLQMILPVIEVSYISSILIFLIITSMEVSVIVNVIPMGDL